MPRHEISLKILQGITVLNTDIEVAVRSDGELLGRIRISRGSIDWIPAQKRSARRLSWTRFADLMEESGRPVERPDRL
jgi:hypothetical protein